MLRTSCAYLERPQNLPRAAEGEQWLVLEWGRGGAMTRWAEPREQQQHRRQTVQRCTHGGGTSIQGGGASLKTCYRIDLGNKRYVCSPLKGGGWATYMG